MDPTRALDTAIDDLPTARALIASLQEQLTKSQREIAALRHELDILVEAHEQAKLGDRLLRLPLGVAAHAGSACCFDSGRRVFDNQTLASEQGELAPNEQVFLPYPPQRSLIRSAGHYSTGTDFVSLAGRPPSAPLA